MRGCMIIEPTIPQPNAGETAVVVTGLEPDVEYCFRVVGLNRMANTTSGHSRSSRWVRTSASINIGVRTSLPPMLPPIVTDVRANSVVLGWPLPTAAIVSDSRAPAQSTHARARQPRNLSRSHSGGMICRSLRQSMVFV